MEQQQLSDQQSLPHDVSLKHAASISLIHDKPIILDYYLYSKNKQCRLVKTQDKDTILYKSNEEYTSPLKKLAKFNLE